MKTAHEIRPGNVIMLDGSPWVVLKTETTRSGRNAAIVKLKLKSVLLDSTTETTFKGEDKLDDIILERLDCTYSYFADPMYVFMDAEYNQYDVEAENLGDAAAYIVDGMEDICQVTFYEEKAISVELPITVSREVTYTEPSARGDTSGKVMKPATIAGGSTLSVADFVKTGDMIEIDTRTNEFKKRV
ncbi:elongation factor P [Shewanella sp. Choline-02u-19]|jgi:elongation factor P|uniref:elongation factor P n=1 Tax=Shewanella TaxID=22 RepID=UPI000C3468B2|nr:MULTISPECIES: elongation factor P [Shewanella]MCL1060129.1 elongation factor P [Shewanella gelidimarina]PKG59007.1 elongation factor P [Shewanella sp. GutDb-MelDb]PKG73742.1 elongation factor P [Shewanella sp. GutCb]PKH56334.1 elongation factor P [Shewanella sp. Bg11-22]PKI27572.1 elongation factor P [Shewanella sp. Choline-02u-19]